MSDTIQDPLAVPAGSCEEPSFPVLREGVRRMIIKGFEEKTFEGKEGKPPSKALSIKLTLQENDRSSEDQVLYAGWGFNETIFLTPNENNSAKQISERAAMPVKAALGKDTKTTARQCIDNPSLILDKVVEVKVGIRVDKSGKYGDSNTVKAWIVK